jgi:hypothetical protein
MPDKPVYPPAAMTTYELRDLRRDLEHAISGITPGTPVPPALRARLEDVLAEQHERAHARRPPADSSCPGTAAAP